MVTIGDALNPKKRHVDRLFIGDDIHKVEESAGSYLRKQAAAHNKPYPGQTIEYDLELVTEIVPIK